MKPIIIVIFLAAITTMAAAPLPPAVVSPVAVTNGPLETYYSPDIGTITVQPMIRKGVQYAIGHTQFGTFFDRAITNDLGEVDGYEGNYFPQVTRIFCGNVEFVTATNPPGNMFFKSRPTGRQNLFDIQNSPDALNWFDAFAFVAASNGCLTITQSQ